MWKRRINVILAGVGLALLCLGQDSAAKEAARVHPMNMKLVKAGIMKNIPTYFPEIPRVTAATSLGLYRTQKALFLLSGYKDLHLIHGGIHLTEGQAKTIDPNKLPFKKGQVLVIY